MIFFWMLFAIGLTIIGSLLILVLQDGTEDHHEELGFEERTTNQRASIMVAECDAKKTCRDKHEKAKHRVKQYRAKRKKT